MTTLTPRGDDRYIGLTFSIPYELLKFFHRVAELGRRVVNTTLKIGEKSRSG
jgi:hypothetical protein